MNFIAKTSAGLEQVLSEELSSYNFKDIKILRRAVSFTGNITDLYKANYCLRTALRILMPITEFVANTDTELYNNIYNIEWEKYFDYKKTIYIDASSYSNIFRHTGYVAQKTKDAIVDYFRNKFTIRPNVEKFNPDIVINLHIFENNVIVSLDSSGKPLNQRGYREHTGDAPLNEVIAAGLILISKWNKKSFFIDPMCGSGTIPIEAAYIATNTPAGYNRKNYSFMHWNSFNSKEWDFVKEKANSDIVNSESEIICSDINSSVIDIAFKNAKNAGFTDIINFKIDDFFNSNAGNDSGTIIFNPPYGERLKIEDIYAFNKSIGNKLKNSYSGFKAGIILMKNDEAKSIGLKSSKKITIFNGPIECLYLEYELYHGSHKKSVEKTI